CNVTLNYP
nr:Chain C, CYS-ASN-VAL-THR-LEU-ASN-TYR-PRO [uncultured virus]7EDO_F Chain F, CYS-ASN-VAL-THR-LEU-ASN-TYR-PRO [uncultured virus]